MSTESTNNIQSSKGVTVIKNLVVKPARVDTTDVATWKQALVQFNQGNGTMLYNLYDNIMADGFLSDAIFNKRVGAVTNAEITFQLDGKNVEEIDDLIDTPEFEELITEICLSKAYGKSVIEVGFSPDFWTYSFPRQNLRTLNMNMPLKDRKHIIVEQQGQTTGYDYSKDPYIWSIGKDLDAGYIFKAALYVIYKRGGFGDWAQFAEIFGMPFVTGEYDGQDTQQRDQVFDALMEIGSHPVAAYPKGANIEVHDNKSTGSTNLFDTLRKACNEEILVAVLGNTMTTVNGSSRSQGEVHENQQKNIAKSDRRFVQRILNKYFVPLLIQHGYQVAGGFFSFPDLGENMTTVERVDLGLKLRGAGIPVANNYFYEITGIPASEQDDPDPNNPDDPNNTNPPASSSSPSSSDDNNNDDGTADPTLSDPPPNQSSIINIQSSIKRFFESFFAFAPTTRSGANQNLSWRTKLIAAITGRIALADDYTIDINKLVNRAIREIYENAKGISTPPLGGGDGGGASLVNESLFTITNTPLQTVIDRNMLYARDDEFIRQLRNNTAVFSAFKNHQQTAEMVSLLVDEEGNLRSFSKFRKLALQVSAKYNEQWLRTEYNTAVRAARQAANFMNSEATADLYPNLEYMHTVASAPREEHLEFVGTILPRIHPWWKRYLPPNGWDCQCWVRNTDKEPTAVPDSEDDVDPVFANNPAYSAELIKTSETPYYENTPDELRQPVEQLGIKYQKEYEAETGRERYEGKKGGYLDIVRQNDNEFEKNLKVYKFLADRGGKYALLPPSNTVKTPDAFNFDKGWYSDAKNTVSTNGKTLIQNALKEAGKQGAQEVVVSLSHDIPSWELYRGLSLALSGDRNKILKRIILIRKDREPVYLDADELRERFKNKKGGG